MTNETKKIAAFKCFIELRTRLLCFVAAFEPIDAYVESLPALESDPEKKAIDGDVRALANGAWSELNAVCVRLDTIRRGGAPTPSSPIETAADMVRVLGNRAAATLNGPARGLLDDYLADPGAYDSDKLRGAVSAALAASTALTAYLTEIHNRAWAAAQARATPAELAWHAAQNEAAASTAGASVEVPE